MDEQLISMLENAVTAAVGRSSLNVSAAATAAVLGGRAAALAAVESLRERRPQATVKEIFTAAAEAALERINSIASMVPEGEA